MQSAGNARIQIATTTSVPMPPSATAGTIERGWVGLTTNAAAEVAGVSIGSLYQYFPNKLALVEAVRRRHFDQYWLR